MPENPASESPSDQFAKVTAELSRYRHHLLQFEAVQQDDGIHILITANNLPEGAHVYDAMLHPRDLEGPQFPWNLQRMLYDFIHDYLVELFIDTPQSRSVP